MGGLVRREGGGGLNEVRYIMHGVCVCVCVWVGGWVDVLVSSISRNLPSAAVLVFDVGFKALLVELDGTKDLEERGGWVGGLGE